MIVLLPTYSLKLKLVAGVTTNEIPVRVSYSLRSNAGYNGLIQLTTTTGGTNVTICDAVTTGVIDIDSINIPNEDTAPVEVYMVIDDGTTEYVEVHVTILSGDQLSYTHANGWRKIDSTGSFIGVGATGAAGQGVPTGGTADQVLAKIDGTNYNTYWKDVIGGVVTQFEVAFGAALNQIQSSSNFTYDGTEFLAFVEDALATVYNSKFRILSSKLNATYTDVAGGNEADLELDAAKAELHFNGTKLKIEEQSVTIGQLVGGNGTKFIIDDAAQSYTFNKLTTPNLQVALDDITALALAGL